MIAADEEISVTLILRAESSGYSKKKELKRLIGQAPHQRKHLLTREFTRRYGARSKDLQLIKDFAKKNHLQLLRADKASRSVVLSGSIQSFSKAFQVQFTERVQKGLTYRSHSEAVQIPSDIKDVVEAVLGLDNRPLMSHHMFAHASESKNHLHPQTVMDAYEFPTGANGKGQRIAIIELGGGYYDEDIKNYFQKLNLPLPKIATIEIDEQRNDPASKDLIKQMLDAMGALASADQTSLNTSDAVKALWTIESTLDIELAGSFANGADLVVYYAPNNAQGKYHALSSALHSEKFPPTIIACSWGATEQSLTPDFVNAVDQVFQDAALKGVSVCFSSGDRGEDADGNGSPRVHFPASSPHVLSCGGTHWVKESCADEVVWSEQLPKILAQSGGGVSKVFETPEWQVSADVQAKTKANGRGVPDVAGKADMASGYETIVGGYSVTMGGTSSAVPLWAGLIARLNQELGKNIGFITPYLYGAPCSDAFRDIVEGNNGSHYRAERGWDACTGWGTPNGKKLLVALKS
jgi:kumamolisin